MLRSRPHTTKRASDERIDDELTALIDIEIVLDLAAARAAASILLGLIQGVFDWFLLAAEFKGNFDH